VEVEAFHHLLKFVYVHCLVLLLLVLLSCWVKCVFWGVLLMLLYTFLFFVWLWVWGFGFFDKCGKRFFGLGFVFGVFFGVFLWVVVGWLMLVFGCLVVGGCFGWGFLV
jgi:hypothetical protein